ncbi:hypothetical protein C5167_020239 [Papaver somniferum]|uniref:Uncharacterized protein n=1 Tax=Papaver somniferum TaxID=3469 RepID=A0A4Y7IVK3_PAPSO|nr:hypothetical protein C5167_020239 [Papaver somniferum]
MVYRFGSQKDGLQISSGLIRIVYFKNFGNMEVRRSNTTSSYKALKRLGFFNVLNGIDEFFRGMSSQCIYSILSPFAKVSSGSRFKGTR